MAGTGGLSREHGTSVPRRGPLWGPPDTSVSGVFRHNVARTHRVTRIPYHLGQPEMTAWFRRSATAAIPLVFQPVVLELPAESGLVVVALDARRDDLDALGEDQRHARGRLQEAHL